MFAFNCIALCTLKCRKALRTEPKVTPEIGYYAHGGQREGRRELFSNSQIKLVQF